MPTSTLLNSITFKASLLCKKGWNKTHVKHYWLPEMTRISSKWKPSLWPPNFPSLCDSPQCQEHCKPVSHLLRNNCYSSVSVQAWCSEIKHKAQQLQLNTNTKFFNSTYTHFHPKDIRTYTNLNIIPKTSAIKNKITEFDPHTSQQTCPPTARVKHPPYATAFKTLRWLMDSLPFSPHHQGFTSEQYHMTSPLFFIANTWILFL